MVSSNFEFYLLIDLFIYFYMLLRGPPGDLGETVKSLILLSWQPRGL